LSRFGVIQPKRRAAIHDRAPLAALAAMIAH
jgi:hypothetical protein